ncbi:Predicted amino acid racemase [Thiothrix eikelboomii]|uniref:Predicted amino acid racemase n=1 Tax=Thiothrix eikelboomii TaxID=92487 RepID=A0A1T4XWS9_9GAMM|nr:alanine racemase [Thiothrix eikelboomii]SKA93491.1 Predicted amino acid racemase [Thiothrix eikelboomii]
MLGPQVIVDLDIIEANARAVTQTCAMQGIEVFGVTKGTCGMPQVARAMLRGGVTGIGESRFENIRRLRAAGINCPMLLLRSPPLALADEVVRYVDISLNSELPIIQALSEAALRRGKVHEVILMVDLGDLREGIWPDDLRHIVAQVLKLRGVRIAGLGTNLLCLSAVKPTRTNLGKLSEYAQQVEQAFGIKLRYVSGGNSGSLPLLLEEGLPAGINHLRVGEAILQGGRDTFYDEPWELLNRNAFVLQGELLAVKRKPSLPIGETAVDAFGNTPVFVDRGERLRGILNIGREDVSPEHLVPIDPRVELIGASSDHLILDLEAVNPPPQVGATVSFYMSYPALLAAMTSEYVRKTPVSAQGKDQASQERLLAQLIEPELVEVVASLDISANLAALHFDTPADTYHCASSEQANEAVSTALQTKAFPLLISTDTLHTLAALQAATQHTESIGLIWLAAEAAYEPLHAVSPHSMLYHAMQSEQAEIRLTPQLSPENLVMVGLRNTTPDEAAALNRSGIKVFTMSDIDVFGMHEVINRAIRIASSGTQAVWLHYSPTATDIRGDRGEGEGGLTFRETHQAMENIAQSTPLLGISVSHLQADDNPQRVRTVLHFILSALGQQII